MIISYIKKIFISVCSAVDRAAKLPDTAEVAERTVGTVDGAEDRDGPEMENMSLVI